MRSQLPYQFSGRTNNIHKSYTIVKLTSMSTHLLENIVIIETHEYSFVMLSQECGICEHKNKLPGFINLIKSKLKVNLNNSSSSYVVNSVHFEQI